MNLRESIDDVDVLIADLSELRSQLCVAELDGDRSPAEQALWSAEVGLRHVARRADNRARIVRRAIELIGRERIV